MRPPSSRRFRGSQTQGNRVSTRYARSTIGLKARAADSSLDFSIKYSDRLRLLEPMASPSNQRPQEENHENSGQEEQKQSRCGGDEGIANTSPQMIILYSRP